MVKPGGLRLIFFPAEDLLLALVLDKLLGILLGVVILGGLGISQSISGGMGIYTIPEGYIIIFHDIEVDINDGIAELNGF